MGSIKILTVGVLCSVAAVFAAGCSGEKKTPEEISVEAVPVGTMIVCKIRNPEAFSVSASESKYLEAFGGTDAKKDAARGYGMMLRLGGDRVSSRPMTVAVSKVGAKGLSFLYISEVGNRFQAPSFGADTTLADSEYEKTVVTTVTAPDGDFSYYVSSGVLVGSTDRLYLEQSVLQSASGATLSSDGSFAKAFSALPSGREAVVLVNLPAVSSYVEKSLGFREMGLPGRLSPWLSAELAVDTAMVTVEGMFCASDSTSSFARVLSAQKSGAMTLDSYFPASTQAYTYLGVSDWKKFFADNMQYLKASSHFHLYNNAVQKYNKLFGGDFVKFFTPWAGKGIAVVRVAGEPYYDARNSVFVGVSDAEAARNALEMLRDSSVVPPDKYGGYDIVPVDRRTVFSELVEKSMGPKGVGYGAVLGDVAVFSHDLSVLKTVIDDVNSGTTLASSQQYKQAKSSLATNTNMLAMVRGDLWSADMAAAASAKLKARDYSLSEVEKYMRSNFRMFSKLKYNFFQVSSTGGVPFLNSRFMWDDSVPREAVKAWSFKMDAAPAADPVAFPNHKTGRYDVLAFDVSGNMYLISDQGKLFWKKKLASAVSSPVIAADLYDNKKYQMVFSTADGRFHVIDRNGNYVTSADKVARAKKMKPSSPDARISSTNEISVLLSGKMQKVKTPHSPVSHAVYVGRTSAVVYSVSGGKIYGIGMNGQALPGYPVPGGGRFTAADFSKNGQVCVVTASPEGSLSMYRMPGK